MTDKIFWQNPYQTELESKVVAIHDQDIELSATIFYADSCGQESDSGTIGGIPVIHAETLGESIIYTLVHKPEFLVGDIVMTVINWHRRYALMKLHFATEVVLELFVQEHPEMQKIGAHIAEEKSLIDFAWKESLVPLLPFIQQKAQALLDADFDIQCDFLDSDAQRQYWGRDDFKPVSCGGTPLKKTSEVGQIKLKRKNIGRGKERVEIALVD